MSNYINIQGLDRQKIYPEAHFFPDQQRVQLNLFKKKLMTLQVAQSPSPEFFIATLLTVFCSYLAGEC